MTDEFATGRGVSVRVAALLDAFSYSHLPPELQQVSRPFWELAARQVRAMGATAGATQVHLEDGLLNLLRAKDAIVRAALQA